ncbi:homoserine kinase [Desulfohalotomaculum tongense]|uniref:homoserine kinase n=1 Tax=Desulforadius tongensis TaxID=1216062 RepID=UPI00195C38BD|nr:homoserine kinase [Desulforadius tongensis]MBM7854622.1 homoserine kinase [Desulforadius tongensis]
MIRVQVPATTANLGPGFDCLGMALKLYNTVEMDETSAGLTIEVHGDGAASIPRDESNIVYKAAHKVFQHVNYNPAGLKIRLTNRVPVCRGLGSSAAAIVGGIVAANILSGGKLSKDKLLALANEMEGHPDNVAPALLGGIIAATAAEGEVRYLYIAPPAGLKTVVAVPDFQLSTKRAREVLPGQVPLQDAVFNVGRTALLVTALCQGDLSKLNYAMEDRLHQSYRASLVPGMKKVLAAARLAGARGVVLSGAGPTLIAFADENFDLIAKVMRDTFRENGIMAKVMVLEPSPVGARAVERM